MARYVTELMVQTYSIWRLQSLSTGATEHSFAHFGQGSNDIFLDEVMCDGSESRLLDCPYDPNHDCSHFEDAGVTCAESSSKSVIYSISTVTLILLKLRRVYRW